ncbi:RagB/SusD family nutrient uptake outer membrane protein [Bacteroides sp. 519]|uniref:RagB/SusD family nutrient uptake outer membrane protein n=1 Tax=Bacteroides sp. 519 TaxID=2302937 RepID=UPI0013D8B95D|nr:RagB/SusD family nutrient uptake outer membrane protein [Bacteroides sp. 519]NDV59401.1 RagB/SusD family nutrient uptake outer membrane protein [Bacteroides sp. 519]
MKAKYIYILLLGLLPILNTGCENRLDIAKHGNLGGQEDFYKTDADAIQALASLYSSWGGNYYNWYMTKNLLADDVWCGGGSRGDNSSMEQLNEYTFDTDHAMVQDMYSGMYAIIYKSNLIIDLLAPDSDVKKRAIAEARFFRAWANFELVTLFGTAPVVDHLLQPNEYRQGNSTPEALWSIIESDLGDAINSGALPSKTDANDSETTIRVTREVAQAMLGKAYLFQGKYADAALILDKVIESDKYRLYDGDYDMLLHVAANGSSESMLEVQKRNDSEQAWNQMTMTFLMMGWRSDKLNISWDAITYIATGTYGFLNPRKSLYDAFVAVEGADGYRLNSTMRSYPQMETIGITVQPGASMIGHEGYFMWKNRTLREDCIYDASYFQALQYINLRVMRYAEVLLLAAEAHVMGGSKDKALDYINQTRTRARLDRLTSVTLDDVKAEKRLELCLECVRYQDLVRWGDAETVMAEQGKQIPAFSLEGAKFLFNNPTYGFKTKHKLLPIPRKELELNPNMVQNANW